MRITLAIHTDRCRAARVLMVGERVDAHTMWFTSVLEVPYGEMSTRPDPIRRAWNHLEPKLRSAA